MKDFKTNYGSLVTNSWPQTVAKNASGSSAVDGTPFCADLINDLWGWQKRIMYLAGITPSGIADDYSGSDVVTALRNAGLKPGLCILSFLNATELANARLMALSGQIVTIASYPDLCAAVYVGDASNPTAPAFYKTSDAGGTTRSTTGAYMVMPDCRGLVPRGLGTNTKSFMAAGSGYYGGAFPGSVLLDAMQGHYHMGYTYSGGSAGADYRLTTSSVAQNTAAATDCLGAALTILTDGIHGQPRGDYETRGASFAAQVCIAY